MSIIEASDLDKAGVVRHKNIKYNVAAYNFAGGSVVLSVDNMLLLHDEANDKIATAEDVNVDT